MEKSLELNDGIIIVILCACLQVHVHASPMYFGSVTPHLDMFILHILSLSSHY